MEVPFQNLLAELSSFKYPIVFLLSIVEGPVAMVASGMLYRLGVFSFFPIYFTLMLGDFVADLGWYAVGRFGALKFARRWGHYFSITPELLLRLEKVFERHHDKILFTSKITMGFGFALATLMAAGMARVPIKRYVIFNLLGQFVWTGLLMALGYFFGHLYTQIDRGFRTAFVVGLVVVVLLLFYGASKYFKTKFFKS